MVIMHAYWWPYTAQNCNIEPLVGAVETIKKLLGLGIHHIVVVGPKERWDAPLPKLILSEMQKSGRLGAAPERIIGHVLPGPEELEPKLRKAVLAAGAKYISALGTLCNEQGCLASLGPEDHPMSYDFDEWGHFSDEGSIDFVNRVWTQIEPEIPRHPLRESSALAR
jgi:hypothetical protein